ncbi:MAG: hypothetical protein U1A73_12320 [Pseudomonas sp.]|nr:hypothetical protein [Pseudomonas sp.]
MAWILGLVVALPLLALWLLGIDGNWDLRNYHLYNPHAWLTGRDAIDIAPAQLQSWHNPLLDVPMYLIIQSGADPRWASLWLALPTMASLYFLIRLQRVLGLEVPTRTSQAVLAVLAVSGAAAGSTLGLSMNDAFVGSAMLGALVLLLDPGTGFAGRHRWLMAGLVAGAMAGLKLSAYFYCIGLAAAALATGTVQVRARRLFALGVGGLAGFALSYGYWGWRLWRQHQNPFFPYFNNVFRSPDALSQPWTDGRFLPDSLLDALSSPFQLLVRTSHFSEIPLRDPRLLLGLLGVGFLFWLQRKRNVALGDKLAALLAFVIVSWLVWIYQYGIYRYAITLELIGCLALVLVLQRLSRWRNLAFVLAFLLVSADTKRPNWGRTHFVEQRLGISLPTLPSDSMVVIASQEPLAYFAIGLPDDMPVIAVQNNLMAPGRCMGLQVEAMRRISAHRGKFWLLSADSADSVRAQQVARTSLGLEPAASCVSLGSAIGPGQLCRQKRMQEFSVGKPCSP